MKDDIIEKTYINMINENSNDDETNIFDKSFNFNVKSSDKNLEERFNSWISNCKNIDSLINLIKSKKAEINKAAK